MGGGALFFGVYLVWGGGVFSVINVLAFFQVKIYLILKNYLPTLDLIQLCSFSDVLNFVVNVLEKFCNEFPSDHKIGKLTFLILNICLFILQIYWVLLGKIAGRTTGANGSLELQSSLSLPLLASWVGGWVD